MFVTTCRLLMRYLTIATSVLALTAAITSKPSEKVLALYEQMLSLPDDESKNENASKLFQSMLDIRSTDPAGFTSAILMLWSSADSEFGSTFGGVGADYALLEIPRSILIEEAVCYLSKQTKVGNYLRGYFEPITDQAGTRTQNALYEAYLRRGKAKEIQIPDRFYRQLLDNTTYIVPAAKLMAKVWSSSDETRDKICAQLEFLKPIYKPLESLDNSTKSLPKDLTQYVPADKVRSVLSSILDLNQPWAAYFVGYYLQSRRAFATPELDKRVLDAIGTLDW